MTTVLKLGGSVITDKETPETVDEAALEAAAAAVGDAIEDGDGPDDLVLVHGGGSFGHYHADRHGVSTTLGTHDARALRDVHDAMAELNSAVIGALDDEEVPALPVHPLSVAHRDGSGELTLPAGHVETMVTEGFVPVVQADMIAQTGRGGTVVSGDELVVSLARSLDADRVGLCSTVPGVYDTEGEVIPEIRTFETVEDALGGSDATDVTGGMAEKVRTLLDLEVPATIFAPDALSSFLAGESPGTVVRGER